MQRECAISVIRDKTGKENRENVHMKNYTLMIDALAVIEFSNSK
jgi:tRNA A37 threonylcarbamoyladenosine dehydratase